MEPVKSASSNAYPDDHLDSLLDRAVKSKDIYTAIACARTLGERDGLREAFSIVASYQSPDRGHEYNNGIRTALSVLHGRILTAAGSRQ